MKKEIMYIGDFQFSSINVQAQLVINNGKLFSDIGYTTTYIGVSRSISHDMDILDTHKNYKGFNIYEIPFTMSFSDIIYYRKHLRDIIKILKQRSNTLYAVITYQSPTFSLLLYSIFAWCKKNDVLYITNCADLPLIKHGSLVSRFIKRCNWRLMECINKHCSDGIIAVSRYIDFFYFRKGRPSVIIPPLIDTSEISKPPNISQKVTFVYAGTPFPIDGRKVTKYSYKDRLDFIIELLGRVYDKGFEFRLDIYGITEKEYLKVIDWQESTVEKLRNVVQFHGRCSSEQVKNSVSAADFSINLRNINKMTQAGFSTKFVESISYGTPIITNKTSDIELYLKEGYNGYFLDISDLNGSVERLCEIVQMERTNIYLMKESCYKSKLFDYRKFLVTLNNFVSGLNSSYEIGVK